MSLVVALAGAGVFLAANPAGAHAAVLSSFPSQGAHVARAPTSVTVVFDQPVQPDNGGLVVLDSGASKVSLASLHPRPDELVARLPGSLANGAFVANYTVTSVDGHVVSGGIVFLVGHASVGQIAQLTRSTPAGPQDVSDTGQALLYLGVLGAGGLAFFLAFVMDDGTERRILRRLTLAAVGVAVIGMVVTIWGQSGLLGGDLGSALHWDNLRPTLASKLGLQCGLQLLGLAGCLWSLWVRPPVIRQALSFYGTLVSAGAFAAFGHDIASADRAVAIPADVVHAVVAALWFGGLVGLAIVLHSRLRRTSNGVKAWRPSPPGDGPGDYPLAAGSGSGPGLSVAVLERAAEVAPRTEVDGGRALRTTAAVVGRFSTMAGIAVAFLMAAGLVLAVVEVGSFTNLVDTGYGQLLVLKLGLVGLLLFLAAYNRFVLLPYLFGASQGGRGGLVAAGWRRLRATARLELLGVVAVLMVTTVLANGTPSNGAPSVGPPVPFSATRPFDGGRISLRIDPNQAFVNDISVQFSGPGGAPAEMAESVSVYLVLPSENVGPIETDLKHLGVGRFGLRNSPYPPIIGTWQIVLQVQVSEFQESDVSFNDRVN